MLVHIVSPSSNRNLWMRVLCSNDARSELTEDGVCSCGHNKSNLSFVLAFNATHQFSSVIDIHIGCIQLGQGYALLCEPSHQIISGFFNLLLIRLDFLQRLVDGVRAQLQFDLWHLASPPQSLLFYQTVFVPLRTRIQKPF